MMEKHNNPANDNIIYLIYDHECLVCRNTVLALRIQKSKGKLETINARTKHPLVLLANSKGYDLNEGMILKYQDKFYYGKDALHMLAFLTSPVNWFNKLNMMLFRSKFLAYLFYPVFKSIRKILLRIRGTPEI